MRFFLPELYVQLQSPEHDRASEAEEALDRAGEAYNQHWASIKSRMPKPVVQFYEEQCLHDADVFAPARLRDSALLSKGDIVIVAQQIATLYADQLNTLALLRYRVAKEPCIEIPVASEIWSQGTPTWEYDEFDIVESGIFTHSIFLSDGRVITIQFSEFQYQVAPLLPPVVSRKLSETTTVRAVSA